MANRLSPSIGAGVALCLATLPTAALAADFTPEGHQHWVEVAHALLVASTAETQDMDAPCKGVTAMGGGSEIRHEYSQVPKWAVDAHFRACISFHTVAKGGKGFMHSNAGDVCKGLKVVIDDLNKAKPGVDPDDVVAIAGQLKASLTSLVADYKDAKACRIG